ncbi:MAG: hypothetical protein V7636_1331 [Actinomycetota bacterium]|jgi:hypothetical protein
MTRRVLNALLVLAAIGVIVFVIVSLTRGDSDDEPSVKLSESDDAALSVKEAINRAPNVAFAVRGYVFDDGAFVQLCEGMQDTNPPRCAGSVLLVRNLDLARLNTHTSGKVRWTPEPVVLGGRIDGTQLYVLDVLAGA